MSHPRLSGFKRFGGSDHLDSRIVFVIWWYLHDSVVALPTTWLRQSLCHIHSIVWLKCIMDSPASDDSVCVCKRCPWRKRQSDWLSPVSWETANQTNVHSFTELNHSKQDVCWLTLRSMRANCCYPVINSRVFEGLTASFKLAIR